MIASWMLYSAAISALLGLAALSLDHGLRRRGVPLRWLWVVSICGSFALSAAPWARALDPAPAASPDAHSLALAGPLERVTAPPAAAGPERSASGAVSSARGALIPLSFPSIAAADDLLVRGWLLAAAGVLLYLSAGHRRLSRRRRRWRRETVDGVPVLVARETGPAVVGFLRPSIVVPEWVLALDPARRRLVLAHESEHLRTRDPALLLLTFVLAALMPWNAPLWWQVRRLRHAVELDCDARVLGGSADPATYGELLIDVGSRASERRLGLAAFAESSSFLAARIRNLAAPRPRAWRLAGALCLAIACLALAAACESPTPAVHDPADVGNVAAPNGAPVDFAAAAQPREDSVATPTPPAAAAAQPDSTGAAERVSSADADPGSAASDQGGGHALELMARGRPNIENMVELVRHLHPEVFAAGLPRDRALWFAIDANGNIRRSWIGPNLFINFDDVRPVRWHSLPEGSDEQRRAWEEHEAEVAKVLRDNVPEMRIQARAALVGYRPVTMTLHFMTEAPGRLVWGGRAELAQDIVIRTRLPIAGEKLSLPPVQTLTWRGRAWRSQDPARIIQRELLEPVGEVDGRALYAETGVAEPEVIYRLEREPDVFLPFLRPQ